MYTSPYAIGLKKTYANPYRVDEWSGVSTKARPVVIGPRRMLVPQPIGA